MIIKLSPGPKLMVQRIFEQIGHVRSVQVTVPCQSMKEQCPRRMRPKNASKLFIVPLLDDISVFIPLL